MVIFLGNFQFEILVIDQFQSFSDVFIANSLFIVAYLRPEIIRCVHVKLVFFRSDGNDHRFFSARSEYHV